MKMKQQDIFSPVKHSMGAPCKVLSLDGAYFFSPLPCFTWLFLLFNEESWDHDGPSNNHEDLARWCHLHILCIYGELNGNLKEAQGKGYYFCRWHHLLSYRRYCKNIWNSSERNHKKEFQILSSEELSGFGFSWRKFLFGWLPRAEAEQWQEEHLPSAGMVPRPARWASHSQSWGRREGSPPKTSLRSSWENGELCWWGLEIREWRPFNVLYIKVSLNGIHILGPGYTSMCD